MTLNALSETERELIKSAPAPKHAGAMKAVLTDERFSDDGWIFERKLDGVRCVAIRDNGEVTLLSRNDLALNGRYPEIAAALTAQPQRRFAVDGEVVAFDGAQTSFAKLAQRGQTHVPVFYYVFDVLWVDGQDVRGLPLRTRKRLLREALKFQDKSLRFSTHRNRDGEAYFAQACRQGWEGLIAKRADSSYSAQRSRDWLKLKCEQGQELVIGGFTAPRGSRSDFGALLLGVALRREGRHRFRCRHPPLARSATAGSGPGRAPVRRRGQHPRARSAVGQTRAGGRLGLQ